MVGELIVSRRRTPGEKLTQPKVERRRNIDDAFHFQGDRRGQNGLWVMHLTGRGVPNGIHTFYRSRIGRVILPCVSRLPEAQRLAREWNAAHPR